MLIALLLMCLVVIFYKYIVWNNDFWKKRNIPYVEPNFLFGNFKEVLMGSKHFGVMYTDLYRKFKNVKYFGYFKLRTPGLIIKDTEIIKNIVVKDFASFADNDFQVDPHADPVWAANIFSQTGEQWRKSRNAWTLGMTTSKIKAMFENIMEKSDRMVNYLNEHIKNKPNEPLEARVLLSQFFTDVIVTSVLNLETNSFEDEDNPFRKITKSLFISSFWDSIITLTFIVLPWLGKVLKFRFISKRVENQLIAISHNILQDRRTRGFKKNNTFDSMILHMGNEDTITEIEVAGILFGFLLDGTETSAGVSGYLMYAFASNPHVQEKLRVEIDEAAKEKDDKLTYEDIHKMKYLDMIISETMRLYTPALAMQRLCTKPYDLPPAYPGADPVTIPIGTPIIVPVYALHMDPEFFPNPEKFDPERFSDENKDNIQKFTYLPFGDGPRVCIGSRLAINQMKIGIVALIKNFEVRLAPKMMGKSLEIDPNIFVMRSVDGLWITFHKRR